MRWPLHPKGHHQIAFDFAWRLGANGRGFIARQEVHHLYPTGLMTQLHIDQRCRDQRKLFCTGRRERFKRVVGRPPRELFHIYRRLRLLDAHAKGACESMPAEPLRLGKEFFFISATGTSSPLR